MSAAATLVPDPVPPTIGDAVLDDGAVLQACTRWVKGRGGQPVAQTGLQLSGMYCAACAGTLEAALRTAPGVRDATVVAATQRATVQWDGPAGRLSGLIEAVRAAGYDAVPDAAAPARAARQGEQRRALWRLFVAAFCAMQVMMMATPGYVAGPGELSDDLRQLLNWGGWILTLPVMGFAAGPFFSSAWRHLRARRIGMDVPVVLALLVTFIASMGATFDPQGPFGHEVYFDSLTMFLSFLLGGRYLEMRTRHRAAEELERAMARLPDSVERQAADGSWVRVGVHSLERGDVVRVPVGQAFPADGILLEGSTQVNEALLTGESEPLPRAEGDAVVAASLNVAAPVAMRVDRVGADTRYEAIVSMMRDALDQRPDAARLADRWAGPFLWAVLALALAGGAAWMLIDPSRALWVAVSVLIVTCPCAFSLAAPAALVAAAGGLARRGVVFQRLEAIERLAGITHVFIDKTGTLTEDRLSLRRVVQVRGSACSEAQAVAAAASLAGWSQHPLSRALAEQAPEAQPGLHWQGLAEVAGQGVQGRDAQGRLWQLGAWSWLGGDAARPSEEARVWLACDGCVEAGFVFDEVLRPGAEKAVSVLRERGLALTLLTGDEPGRAQAMGRLLGIDTVVSRATPEDKLARVAAAQAGGGRVAMVGDGINDAPVLARADVALAMGQGALVARTQADAVIASNRPLDLAHAHDTAQRTVRIVRQNLFWAAAYNAICIPLALVGWLPPWAAGLGMATSSLLVVANAQRAAC